VNWTKEDGHPIISDRLGKEECQAHPTVTYFDGQYHLFFCYRHTVDFRNNHEKSYRIGHAYSTDLIHWTRDDETPLFQGTFGSWDSEMQCYPHVFESDGKVYLLYNGNEFGRYGFGLATLEKLNVEYRLNQSTKAELIDHLSLIDFDFKQPLSSRVSIPVYAEKIFERALRFEAWVDGTLTGLVAAYRNETERTGFITHVSTLQEWRNHGIGMSLMKQCIAHLQDLNDETLELEVDPNNKAAIKLYEQLGFVMNSGSAPDLHGVLTLGKKKKV